MEASYLTRHPFLKDLLELLVFVVCVLVGTLFINAFVFRSFNVMGPSMEPTLYTGDRVIVNRLPVTWDMLRDKDYTPKRGQIIVFKNPLYTPGGVDEYIVKRVIAFAGERVTVHDSVLTVYNAQHPNGFHPDDATPNGPTSPTSGEVDTIVKPGTLFVAGDHRQDNYSYDSRSGLGFIPLYDVVGPVLVRIYPLNVLRVF